MPEPNEGGQGSDPTQAFQNRLAKMNGDAMAFATQLFDENFRLRTDKRELEGKVPADGSLVLSKADAARWEAYTALGKPDELKTKLEAAGTLETENASLKREGGLRSVASAGYDFDALRDFDELEGKAIESYEVKTEKDKDGKDVQVAYVTVGGKPQSLDAYAKEKRPKMLAVLKTDGQQSDAGGTRVHGSSSTGGSSGEDVFTRTRKSVEQSQSQKAAAAGVQLIDRFNGRTQNGQQQQ